MLNCECSGMYCILRQDRVYLGCDDDGDDDSDDKITFGNSMTLWIKKSKEELHVINISHGLTGPLGGIYVSIYIPNLRLLETMTK